MDNDFSEKLGAILSDPAALAKIAGLAGSLGLGASPHAKEEKPPEPKPEIKPAQSEKLSETAKNIACGRALLQALKPYLSAERCARIDKILGMMKIAEIMGYLK